MDLKVQLFLHCLILVTLRVTSALRCSDTGYFRANSTYGRNRELLFSSLAANVIAEGGFYNATIGQDIDKVYALALCRKGYETEACFSCVNTAAQDLISQCPNQTEAFSWGGDVPCLVRYSNSSFGSLELEPVDAGYNTGDILSNLTQFDQVWEQLMLQTLTEASKGTSSRLKYYAVGVEALTIFQTIYAFMQCTPDISSSNCSSCLQESVRSYQSCCHGKQGGYVLSPSCFFRWDLYPFYGAFENIQPSPPPQLAPQQPLQPSPVDQRSANNTTKKDNRSISSRTIVIIVVPTIVIIMVLVALVYTFFRRKRWYPEVEADSDAPQMLRIDLGTVRTATGGFSAENKLGQGGFGTVYKGKLPDGRDVAVKRLSQGSSQGNKEFKSELLLLAGLQHRNLVKLLGFCFEEKEKLLVYEFVPNSSLDKVISDPDKRSLLTWNVRHKIIGGIARGLLYLHEDSRLRIIHRDLKASNILLDAEMNSKISDFGMARLFAMDESRAVTSNIVGTYGYMAPEYIKHGVFSVKSDVYSFGVLVLEIISGQKNTSPRTEEDTEGLPAYAWKRWSEDRAQDLIDPLLRNGLTSEIMRCIHIGLLCVQENVARRPTMNAVVLWLSSDSTSMPLPSTPAYFIHSRVEQDAPLSLQNSLQVSGQSNGEAGQFSVNEASITQLYPR